MGRPGIRQPPDAWLQSAKVKEQAFVLSNRKEVASGGTLNINLKNPSDSSTLAHVARILGGTQFKADITIHDDFSSAPSGGSENSIDNLRLDADGVKDTGVMISRFDVSYTANSPHFQTVIPSGGSGGQQIGGAVQGTEPIIEPGREIVVEIENTSNSAADAGLGIVYFEE